MNKSAINDLIGLSLSSHGPVEDYYQFSFSEGAAMLSVYNPHEFRGPDAEPVQNLSGVVGQQVLFVETHDATVVFGFSEGWSLIVDISPDAYTGPEAITLHFPGRPPLVWN